MPKEGPEQFDQVQSQNQQRQKTRENYVASLRAQNLPENMTVEAVAQILRVDVKTIYQMAHSQELESTLISRVQHIKRESLFEFLLKKPSIGPV